MPAPNGSIEKEIPSATPCRGRQPPNQYSIGAAADRSSRIVETTAANEAAATASGSPIRQRENCDTAVSAAAAASGTAIGSGASISTGSARHRPQALRVERLRALLRLDGQGEQERGHGDADDDVRQGQRLHDGIDRPRPRRHVGEDRRRRALPVPDREQEHVGRGLRDREADDEVDEVAARDDAVEADREQPRREQVRQQAHVDRLPRTSSISSRNSMKRIVKAAATATPTRSFSSAIVPLECSVFAVPSGTRFSRNAPPAASVPSPIPTKAPTLVPSARSTSAYGLARRNAR